MLTAWIVLGTSGVPVVDTPTKLQSNTEFILRLCGHLNCSPQRSVKALNSRVGTWFDLGVAVPQWQKPARNTNPFNCITAPNSTIQERVGHRTFLIDIRGAGRQFPPCSRSLKHPYVRGSKDLQQVQRSSTTIFTTYYVPSITGGAEHSLSLTIHSLAAFLLHTPASAPHVVLVVGPAQVVAAPLRPQ